MLEPNLQDAVNLEGTGLGRRFDSGGPDSQLGSEELKCTRKRSDSAASTQAFAGSVDDLPHFCNSLKETPDLDVVRNDSDNNSGNRGTSKNLIGENRSDVEVDSLTLHETEAPREVLHMSGMSSRIVEHDSSIGIVRKEDAAMGRERGGREEVTHATVKNRLKSVKYKNETMLKFMRNARRVLNSLMHVAQEDARHWLRDGHITMIAQMQTVYLSLPIPDCLKYVMSVLIYVITIASSGVAAGAEGMVSLFFYLYTSLTFVYDSNAGDESDETKDIMIETGGNDADKETGRQEQVAALTAQTHRKPGDCRPFINVLCDDGNNAEEFLVDSGSSCSVVSHRLVSEINERNITSPPIEIVPLNTMVTCHNKTPLQVMGKIKMNLTLQCGFPREEVLEVPDYPFYVAPGDVDPVLGNEFLIKHNVDVLNDGNTGKGYLVFKNVGSGSAGAQPQYSMDEDGRIDQVPIVATGEVELKPNSVAIFHIRLETWPHMTTALDNADALIRLEIPHAITALTTFVDGQSKVAIMHEEGNVGFGCAGEIGVAYALPKGCFQSQIPLKNVLSSLHQCSIEFQAASNCFCQMRFQKPPLKLFFLDGNFVTNFPNMDTEPGRPPGIIAELINPKKQYNVLALERTSNHLYAGPHLEQITNEQIKNFESVIKENKVICCVLRETDLGLEEMDFIQRVSRFAESMEIRVYQTNGKYNLCPDHRPVPRSLKAAANIIVLTGRKPQGDIGTFIHTSVIHGRNIDSYIKDDQLNVLVHMNSEKDEGNDAANPKTMGAVIQGIIGEIRKAQCGQMIHVALGISGEATEQMLGHETFNGFTSAGVTPKRMELSGSNNFKVTRGCKCPTCDGSGGYARINDLFPLIEIQAGRDKVSGMDYFDEDLLSTTSQRFPKDSETYSEIGSEVEDICYNDPIISTEHTAEEEEDMDKDMDIKYDYSKIPEGERDFVKWLIKTFEHVWTRNKNQRNFIRDTRIKMKLILDSVPEQNKFYKADQVTATIINKLLMEEVYARRAKVIHQPTFTNPVFIRLRNSREVELMRKAVEAGDNNHIPKLRLIGDYRTLNKHLKKTHSFLPNIKELLQKVAHHNVQSSFDVAKMFPSISIAEDDIHLTTLQSPTNLCVQLLYVAEGIYTAPTYSQNVLQESLVLSNPSVHDLELDKKKYEEEKKEGKRRAIQDYDDLARALLRPSKDDLPPSHTRDYVPEDEVTPEMRNPETQAAREKVYEKKRLAPIIRREEIEPSMLPREAGANMYMDDGHLGTRDNKLHRDLWVALMIDLSNNHWLLSLDKAQFFQIYGEDDDDGELEFVGHILKRGSYRPMQEKANSVSRLQEPNNLKSLQKVLGLLNFMAEHTPNMMQYAEKLYAAIPRARAQGNRFRLNEEERECFQELKNICSSPIALTVPRPNEALFIETDSSNTVVSYMIWSHTANKTRRLVGYQSKLYSQALRSRSSAIERELYGITMSLHFFRHYIYSHPTYLMTDAAALCALFAGNRISPNNKLELMIAKISTYPIRLWIHIRDADSRVDTFTRFSKNRSKDLTHHVPPLKQMDKDVVEVPLPTGVYNWGEFQDAINRDPIKVLPFVKNIKDTKLQLDVDWDKLPEAAEIDQFTSAMSNEMLKLAPALADHPEAKTLVFKKSTQDRVYRPQGARESETGNEYQIDREVVASLYNPMHDCSVENLAIAQSNDEHLAGIIKKLQGAQKLPKYLKGYGLKYGVLLVKKNRDGQELIAASEKMISRICTRLHLMSHSAGQKTAKVVSRYFHAKGIRQIAQQVALMCRACQRFKPLRLGIPQGRLKQATAPHQIWAADHIILGKPVWHNGKQYTAICNVVDEYSSFSVPRLVTSVSTNEILRVINEMKTYYVLSEFELHTDRGSGFVSDKLEKFCEEHAITLRPNLAYSSRSNAKVEKCNDAVRDIFSIIYNTTSLNPETALMLASNAINTTPRGILRYTDITPYETIFGKSPLEFAKVLEKHIPDEKTRSKTRGEIHKLIMHLQAKEEEAHRKATEAYPEKLKLEVGVNVLLKDMVRAGKQQPRYHDQIYKITKRTGHKLTVENINDEKDKFSINARQVKPYDLNASTIMEHLTATQVQNLTQALPSKTKRWKRLEMEWSSCASSNGDDADAVSIDVKTTARPKPNTDQDVLKVVSEAEEPEEGGEIEGALVETDKALNEQVEGGTAQPEANTKDGEHLDDASDEETMSHKSKVSDISQVQSDTSSRGFDRLEERLREILQGVVPMDVDEGSTGSGPGSQTLTADGDDFEDDKVVYATLQKIGPSREPGAGTNTVQNDSVSHTSGDSQSGAAATEEEPDANEKVIDKDVAETESVEQQEVESNDADSSEATSSKSTSSTTSSNSTKQVRPPNELLIKLSEKIKQQEAKTASGGPTTTISGQGLRQHNAFKLPATKNTEHVGKKLLNARAQYKEGQAAGRGMRSRVGRLDYAKLAKDGTRTNKVAK